MSKHIMIEKAHVFTKGRKENNLEMHYFDNEKGYWRNKTTNIPSILDDEFKKPGTKKCDVETGEDRKGE